VNIHERCKKEIEYVALSQWFLQILPYKKQLLALADQITWSPAFMKTRYINWVENISWDWCLSRQRYFGIPFPAWHCATCGHILLASKDSLPIDPQVVAAPTQCPHCLGTQILPDTDVMDTWNTSSLTPYICYQQYTKNTKSVFDTNENFIPMSMRPQAHDIIRTWAFYTMVKTWMHQEKVPWHDIVISGHVLTDTNQKISKSQGGAKLTPESLLERYPADVIRFWTASAHLGHDVAFSENQLKIGHRLVTKLWNAYKFIHEHTQTVATHQSMPHSDTLGSINQWLLHQASACFMRYEQHFKQHEFGPALNAVETLFWSDFCDTYIELIKHQLFHVEKYTPDQVAATQWTLYTVGLRILQLFAPYMPYCTDELYQRIYQQKVGNASLHTTKFSEIQAAYTNAASVEKATSVIRLVEQVRKLKTEQQLSLKTELAQLTVNASQEILSSLRDMQELIKGVTQAKELILTTAEDTTKTHMYSKDTVWHAVVVL
jgi:valyl-tRNA synthetase